MDDVLASIRRIVRSEKEPEEAVEQPEAAPAPAEEPAPVEPAEAAADDADAPLALTPDMLMDPASQADPVEHDAAPEPAPEEAPASVGDMAAAAAAPVVEAVSGDSDGKLRSMIREVLQEQMSGAEASEFVRSVIRDELVNGEIGNNISQNVMALIQSEVAKAVGR